MGSKRIGVRPVEGTEAKKRFSTSRENLQMKGKKGVGFGGIHLVQKKGGEDGRATPATLLAVVRQDREPRRGKRACSL